MAMIERKKKSLVPLGKKENFPGQGGEGYPTPPSAGRYTPDADLLGYGLKAFFSLCLIFSYMLMVLVFILFQ